MNPGQLLEVCVTYVEQSCLVQHGGHPAESVAGGAGICENVSLVVAVLAVTVLTVQGDLPLLAPVVPAGMLALGWKAASGIRGGIENREVMAKSIEATLGIHTIGCIWLAGCALFSIWF